MAEYRYIRSPFFKDSITNQDHWNNRAKGFVSIPYEFDIDYMPASHQKYLKYLLNVSDLLIIDALAGPDAIEDIARSRAKTGKHTSGFSISLDTATPYNYGDSSLIHIPGNLNHSKYTDDLLQFVQMSPDKPCLVISRPFAGLNEIRENFAHLFKIGINLLRGNGMCIFQTYPLEYPCLKRYVDDYFVSHVQYKHPVVQDTYGLVSLIPKTSHFPENIKDQLM